MNHEATVSHCLQWLFYFQLRNQIFTSPIRLSFYLIFFATAYENDLHKQKEPATCTVIANHSYEHWSYL